jgi:hypothetical protein
VRGDVVTFNFEDTARRKIDAETASAEDYASECATQAHAGTQDYARGVASKPVVYRIRNDLSWEDVLLHYQKGFYFTFILFLFLFTLLLFYI